jgi:peptidoglycan hydrolase CwlO-like protein
MATDLVTYLSTRLAVLEQQHERLVMRNAALEAHVAHVTAERNALDDTITELMTLQLDKVSAVMAAARAQSGHTGEKEKEEGGLL